MIFKITLILMFWSRSIIADDWDSDIVSTDLETYNVNLFSNGYKIPWGMAFLPNGDLIVNDISGKMFRVTNNGAEKFEINVRNSDKEKTMSIAVGSTVLELKSRQIATLDALNTLLRRAEQANSTNAINVKFPSKTGSNK